MRPALAVLTLASVVLLVVLTSPDRTATAPSIAMIPDPTTTMGVETESRTEASLPDGTQFIVTIEPGMPADWLATTAGIVVEMNGEVLPAGRLRFFRDIPNTSYLYENGVYHVPAAGILVTLDLDPLALGLLGADAADTLARAIRGNSESGHPVLRLREPFRWASDESGEVMAVRFSDFEVRRGCSELAAACSPEQSLQLIWTGSESQSPTPFDQPRVRLFRLVP